MGSARSIQSPPRALVIGAGSAASFMHLPALARLRDRGALTLAVLCDLNQERANRARHTHGFLEVTGEATAALARPDIELVYIFAVASLHYEFGLRALHAGKHLFVEKPIAPSFAEARDLANVARAQGLIAVGGHNRRFFPALKAAQHHAGSAGWHSVEAVFHKNEYGKSPPFGARSWLSANGVHALDVLLFMMGGPPEVIAAQADGKHIFSALMRWANGATATFHCNNAAGTRKENYVFHALGKTFHVEETRLIVESGCAKSSVAFRVDHDGILAEHEAFLLAVQSGKEPDHSLTALTPSLFLAERIEESYSGPVKLPSMRTRPAAKAASAVRPSILLVEGNELLGPLTRVAGDYPLVSLEDVKRGFLPRSDITAALLGHQARALPPEILAKLPNLNVVGFAGLSMAHLEPQTLLARGISLMHASQAYADSVAEFALGLAILGRRRAFQAHEIMRAGGWGTDPDMTGLVGAVRRVARGLRPSLRAAGLEELVLRAWRETKPFITAVNGDDGGSRDLRGATVGLIGWGANARAFARRLNSAGAQVIAWSEHAEIENVARRVSLGEALAADVVSLHRGLTPTTLHFLGNAELDRLRTGTLLINIGRGALIEPHALFNRLKRGDIFACLDTYEEEPLDARHPLRNLPNVFLTAHIAGGSPDMRAAADEEIVTKITSYLHGAAAETIPARRLITMT